MFHLTYIDLKFGVLCCLSINERLHLLVTGDPSEMIGKSLSFSVNIFISNYVNCQHTNIEQNKLFYNIGQTGHSRTNLELSPSLYSFNYSDLKYI